MFWYAAAERSGTTRMIQVVIGQHVGRSRGPRGERRRSVAVAPFARAYAPLALAHVLLAPGCVRFLPAYMPFALAHVPFSPAYVAFALASGKAQCKRSVRHC